MLAKSSLIGWARVAVCAASIVLIPAVEAADGRADGRVSASGAGQSTLLLPAALEAAGTRIGDVQVSPGSIFDLSDPDEDRALYRLANRLHFETRSDVIAQQLLFKPGDAFSVQAIEESERILRSNRYIQDVSIEPMLRESGVVDINVETTDTWTLEPKVSLSRSGGENKSALGLREMNLFGTGMAVEAMYKTDVDRDYRTLKVVDRNLFNSWYGFTGILENNSDGHTRALEIAKPFYSLDTRTSNGLLAFDGRQNDYFYDAGNIIGEYQSDARHFEVFHGWSKGLRHGWVRRYTLGAAIDERQFSAVPGSAQPAPYIPENRRFVYPFIGFEMVEDDYRTTRNLDQIHRTEDVFLGTRLGARLGYAAAGAGSDRNAWLWDVSGQTGFGDPANSALLLETQLAGRLEKTGAKNLVWSGKATYYKRQSDHSLMFAKLLGRFGEDLDLDQYFLLGGDNGLRGYPLRYQAGDRSALLTVEQRYFTDWYLWKLFRVGGAVFFDVGRVWGSSPVGRTQDELLKDVGVGLRIGNTRSGLGRMTHIDIAMPLDGGSDIKNVQFVVSTQSSF